MLEDTGSIAESGDINWRIMLANLGAWAIVFIVLSKGIKSLGKVANVHMHLAMTFLLLYAVLIFRGAMVRASFR